MQSLIRNRDPAIGPKGSSDEPAVLDKVSYHIQTAMQVLRDDPCGDLKWEQHCTAIYQVLAKAMDLLVTKPKEAPSPALLNDLDAVMGGGDGTTQVSQVQRESPPAK